MSLSLPTLEVTHRLLQNTLLVARVSPSLRRKFINVRGRVAGGRSSGERVEQPAYLLGSLDQGLGPEPS